MLAPGPEADNADRDDLERTGIDEIVRRGRTLVYGFLAVFLLWGLLFPLNSSVVTEGVITSAGSNKLIQHVSGGRIRSISVAEGAHVEKGDLIMVLDTEVDRARLSELEARQAVLLARRERLRRVGDDVLLAVEDSGQWQLRTAAAREPASAFTSPWKPGTESANERHAGIFESQEIEHLLAERQHDAEAKAGSHEIRSLVHEMTAMAARKSSLAAALEMVGTEIANMRPLVRRGYLARKLLWEKTLEQTRTEAEIVDLEARIARLGEQIARDQSRQRAIVLDRERQAARELTAVLGDLAEIGDQIVSARSALVNTEIRAPVDGTLTSFSVNTIGGVIRGGAVIGEIVPDDAPLIVRAMVRPQDIVHVRQGMTARADVTALDRRSHDPVDSVLTYVSADVVAATPGIEPHYVAHARIDRQPLDESGTSLLKPGMTVALFINTGRRPFLAYLAAPLARSFKRAFNEP